MKDQAPEEKDGKQKPAVNTKELLGLSFGPDWSKKTPGDRTVNPRQESGRNGPPRKGKRPQQGQERSRQMERPRRPDSSRRPEGPRTEQPGRQDRSGASRPSRPPREVFEPLPVDIRFLPDQERLSAVVRELHHSKRAYPLAELAKCFVTKPEFYRIKVESVDKDDNIRAFQCKQCQMISSSLPLLEAHFVKEHMDVFFETVVVETEGITGNFTCIGRCGLSRELLGPSNHHSYSTRVEELHRTRYSHLSLEDYKKRIEMVRDEETIAQWQESTRKQISFKLKGQDDAEYLTRADAEKYLVAQVIPKEITRAKRAVMPGSMLAQLVDDKLKKTIEFNLRKEARFPFTLMIALRSAFRHMKLYLFKFGGKVNFVSSVQPAKLDADKVAQEIKNVFVFITDNPGKNRAEIVEAMRPLAESDETDSKIATELSWLLEKGHIIEYFDGTVSLPGQKFAGKTENAAAMESVQNHIENAPKIAAEIREAKEAAADEAAEKAAADKEAKAEAVAAAKIAAAAAKVEAEAAAALVEVAPVEEPAVEAVAPAEEALVSEPEAIPVDVVAEQKVEAPEPVVDAPAAEPEAAPAEAITPESDESKEQK